MEVYDKMMSTIDDNKEGMNSQTYLNIVNLIAKWRNEDYLHEDFSKFVVKYATDNTESLYNKLLKNNHELENMKKTRNELSDILIEEFLNNYDMDKLYCYLNLKKYKRIKEYLEYQQYPSSDKLIFKYTIIELIHNKNIEYYTQLFDSFIYHVKNKN
jgi:hypothetical protein